MTQRRKWTKELVIAEINSLNRKFGRRPNKRDSSYLYASARKFFGSWNNAMKEAGFEVKLNQKPNLPKKLDEDLAYFLGLLITDGHIVFDDVHKKYKVMLFNSYTAEQKIIINLIKQLFDYEPKIRKKKYGFNKLSNHEIYITSKDLAGTLTQQFKIPNGAKSKIVQVPNYLFNSKKTIKGAFLRGVIDGDGHVAKNRPNISVSSGSKEFLDGFGRLLNGLNMHPSSPKSKGPSNPNTFEINLCRKEEIKRLFSIVYQYSNYFYPRKKRAWEDLKNRFS